MERLRIGNNLAFGCKEPSEQQNTDEDIAYITHAAFFETLVNYWQIRRWA